MAVAIVKSFNRLSFEGSASYNCVRGGCRNCEIILSLKFWAFGDLELCEEWLSYLRNGGFATVLNT